MRPKQSLRTFGVGVSVICVLYTAHSLLFSNKSSQWSDGTQSWLQAENQQDPLWSNFNGTAGKETWEKLKVNMPFAPVDLMKKYKEARDKSEERISKCRSLPMPWKLKIVNQQWQVLRISSIEIYLYSAFYDDRPFDPHSIRMLVMANRPDPPIDKLACLLWYEDQLEPIISNVTDHRMTWMGKARAAGTLNPFILTCHVNGTVPSAVSLVGKPGLRTCRAVPSNVLSVHNSNTGKKQDLAVCVKGISFMNPEMALRLVEWIELLRLLGVNKIFIHYTNIADQIFKVLQYYQDTGFVSHRKYIWAGDYSEQAELHDFYRQEFLAITKQDNIPYNDCFYRNVQAFKYISILDVDEVIMPRFHDNLLDMLDFLEEEHSTARGEVNHFRFKNTYFMDSMTNPKEVDESIPSYMHILRHTVRSEKHTNGGVPKSIMKTDSSIKTTIGHYPSHCVSPKGITRRCKGIYVNEEIAHLAHYREGCQISQRKQCEEYTNSTVVDAAALRFKDKLIANVEKIVKKLKLLAH